MRTTTLALVTALLFPLIASQSAQAQTQALTTLYAFCALGSYPCTDGALPGAGLIQATDGNFYGTTTAGGANNFGTVFKITPCGVDPDDLAAIVDTQGSSDGGVRAVDAHKQAAAQQESMTSASRALIVPIHSHDLSGGVDAAGLRTEAARKIDGGKAAIRPQKAVTMDNDRRVPHFVGAHDVAGLIDPVDACNIGAREIDNRRHDARQRPGGFGESGNPYFATGGVEFFVGFYFDYFGANRSCNGTLLNLIPPFSVQ